VKTGPLLALDTSTMTASLAVIGGAREVALDRAVGSHSDDLMALIDGALGDAGAALGDLCAVAVGAGPGSFTGLRIGMATAKGLCFAAGLPLWAVSSLAALALDIADTAGDRARDALLVPLLDARRGEVFAGFYRLAGGGLSAAGAERVLPAGDLAAAVAGVAAAAGAGSALLAGDALAAHPGALAGAGELLDSARATPSARSVARLALSGAREDVLRAGTPVYIRPSEAEVKFPDGNPGGPFVRRRGDDS